MPMRKVRNHLFTGIIAAQADIGDDVKIIDPNDPSGKNILTGAAARMEIAKNSILYTGYAPGGFDVALKALNDSVVNSTTQPDSGGAYVDMDTRKIIGPQSKGLFSGRKWYGPKSEDHDL